MSQTAPHRHDVEAAGPPPSFGHAAGPVEVGQAESVAAWLGWHAVELVGVGVPVALALIVSGWLAVLAVPAASLWAVQEARRRAQIRGTERSTGRGALTSADITTSGRDEETER